MKFMDKKEQVLDTQLTPYGEYLLSQGRFKPEYYAFFDDNVLYESEYASQTEGQNNIESRIQEDTPQLETQVVFSDRNIFVRKDLQDELGVVSVSSKGPIVIREGGLTQSLALVTDAYFERKMYELQSSLGTSDILKTNAPAWSVSLLRGEIQSSNAVITGSATVLSNAGDINWYPTPTLKIPQLNIDLEYTISVKNDIRFISDTELAIEYPNGEFLDIKPEIVLAQVIERNCEFSKENFDIEVFIVEEEKTPGTSLVVERLKPLKFRKPIELVQGNILRDPDEIVTSEDPITKEYVEYYLNIKLDSQIDEQLMCSSIDSLGKRGFYVDTEIECKEVKNISLVDIYTTDAVSPGCPDINDLCDNVGTIY